MILNRYSPPFVLQARLAKWATGIQSVTDNS